MASNCTLGIQNLVKTTLNNKPWFEYDQSLGIVNILDSPKYKINKQSSFGVAKVVVNAINKQINNGYKNIGDIAFAKFDEQRRGYVDIAPTINQIQLINAQNEEEINELQKQLDEERETEYFEKRAEYSNEYINDDGDFVSKEDLNNFQEEQKKLDKIVADTNNLEEKSDTYFNITPEVDFNLKATQILSSPKADEIFRKGDKNNWSIDKILQELQIPQQQKELLLSFNTRNREELLTNLLANYSYAIEINTAKDKPKNEYGTSYYIKDGYFYQKNDEGYFKQLEGKDNPLIPISEKEYEQNAGSNTQYYSNLTVPGGTNYTENEIATPLITPSIKGHAQFATPNGIGWFRADESQQYQETDIQSIIDNLQKSGQLEINCK